MKALSIAGAFALAAVAQAAMAAGSCNLHFSDDNGNGVGSVEGQCRINQEFETFGGDSPSFQLIVRGLERGERRVVYQDGSLPIVRNPRDYGDGVVFWDRNRNGDGTVQGTVRFYGVEDWRSRSVEVVARIDGREYRLYRGRLSRNGGWDRPGNDWPNNDWPDNDWPNGPITPL